MRALESMRSMLLFVDGADTLAGVVPVATMLVALPSPSGASAKESGWGVERETMFLRVYGLGGGKGKGELESNKPKGKEEDL